MTRSPKILIVEDDETLLKGLSKEFAHQGYDVDTSWDGEVALQKSLSNDYDLILLDVSLPKKDGFAICQAIKEEKPEQAILFLTARSETADHIFGLKLGADDYVSKPFSLQALSLRVAAILRRVLPRQEAQQFLELSNGVLIDTYSLTAVCKDQPETEIPLTNKEVALIQYLSSQMPRPVGQSELLREVWGYEKVDRLQTRTVDSHVARLRRKIERDPKHPEVILTCRGLGYRMVMEGESEVSALA